MNTQDFETQNENHDAGCRHRDEERKPGLERKMRLVSRLMRAEMRKTLRAEAHPTRGDLKAAIRAIDTRVTEAVSPEDLETTLATLDRIAEAFGGHDALPLHPSSFGRRGIGGARRRGHAHHGNAHGHEHGPHRPHPAF